MITLVTAAPALAASGAAALAVDLGNPQIGFDGVSYRIDLPATITNAGTQATTALVYTLDVTLNRANQWGVARNVTSTDSLAPSTGTAVGSDGRRYVFTLTAGQQLPGNAQRAVTFTVTTGSGVGVNFPRLVLTATPGGSGTPGSATYAGSIDP